MYNLNTPAWLEELGYPVEGVGSWKSLNPSLSVSDGGKWALSLSPGWVFDRGSEHYEYLDAQTVSVSAAAGSSIINLETSVNPLWGPVRLIGTEETYTQVSNLFSLARAATWEQTATANVWSTTHDLDKLFYTARHKTIGVLSEIESLRMLNSENQCYYDLGNRSVYVYSLTNPASSVFVDYLLFKPILEINDICVIESNSILTSYFWKENTTIEYQGQTLSISGITSGALSVSDLNATDKDWCVVRYHVPYSYCQRDHKTLWVYTESSSADSNIDIFYEGEEPLSKIPQSTNKYPGSGIIHFNPLLPDSFPPGFIFYSSSSGVASDIFTPKGLDVFVDRKEYFPQWNEQVGFTIKVYGENGLPLPYAEFSSAVSGNIVYSYPSSSACDSRGECRLILSGVSTLAVSAATHSFSSLQECSALAPSGVFDEERYVAGGVSLLPQKLISPDGLKMFSINTYCLDGIPRSSTILVDDLEVVSEAGALMSADALNSPPNARRKVQALTSVGPTGLFAFNRGIGVELTPGDRIVARQNLTHSKVIKVTNGE